MILLSTNSLLVDQGTQTEVEILSDEIRLESISSNSPGQVLGHIDTHDTLSIGRQFACAVTENSSVVCWGRTDYGQTGIGTSGSQAYHNMTYVDALNGMGIVEVSAHLDHACGLTSQGGSLLLGKQPKWPDRQRASRRERTRPNSGPVATGRRRKVTLAGTECPHLHNQHRWRPVLLGQ